MSFDIFFQPCRFGPEPVEEVDPFTGEVRSDFPVEPLTVEETEVIKRVLRKVGAQGPDEFGCYVVEFEDGSGVEVFGRDLSGGLMVAARSFTPELMRFLFDLLNAVDWVMLPAMEENPAIVARSGLARGPLGTLPEVVCGSPEELGVILSGGFEAWKKYRDQVVGESDERP